MNQDSTNKSPIPGLLATQLLTAEVYAEFLAVSSAGERDLWKKMLDEELDHVAHIRKLLHQDLPDTLVLPQVNVDRMWDSCAQIIRMSRGLFLLRLEGALRLECAELDYGLEGLMARRLERSHLIEGYRGDIKGHLSWLLEECARYRESPNIGMQMSRLEELLETSLRDTIFIPTEKNQENSPL